MQANAILALFQTKPGQGLIKHCVVRVLNDTILEDLKRMRGANLDI